MSSWNTISSFKKTCSSVDHVQEVLVNKTKKLTLALSYLSTCSDLHLNHGYGTKKFIYDLLAA